MGRKFTVSYGERVSAVEKYLRYECSQSELAKQLKVGKTTIRRWLARYQFLGPEGLHEASRSQTS